MHQPRGRRKLMPVRDLASETPMCPVPDSDSSSHRDALLQRSWQRAWTGLSPTRSGTGDALCQQLLTAWQEPQRHYHTLQHLSECLLTFEHQRHHCQQPAEVEMALWFHDAVYQVRSGDNEARSAEWARQALAEAGIAESRVDRVVALVMATCHGADEGSTTTSGDPDRALLVDIDLAILAAEPARFAEYELQVRQEYRWVPGWLYRRKRRQVLAGFLERTRLYQTPALYQSWETRARDNLRQALGLAGETNRQGERQ
ncbi:hypothetical protein GCM10022265_16670 [Marinobacter xestospongiae]